MSTTVASVVSHFPSAQNGFSTTLASTIASGAATVPLNSVAGYTNGQIAVLVVDPTDASKKQTFTGTVDTAGVQLTSVVWTAGTNQTHTGGSTVVDYATATHISMVSKGILVEHAQAGTHAAATVTSRTEDTVPASGDYLLTYDVSATSLKKVTVANLLGSNPTSIGAAWASWTPSWTNFTIGNGVLDYAKFIQVGKTVHFKLKFTLGTTSSVTGQITFTTPVTQATLSIGDTIHGLASMVDASAPDKKLGILEYASTTTLRITASTADSTYTGAPASAATSATVPFAFATSDIIMASGTIEAA